MKCKYCDGTGEIINDAVRWTSCPACGGKGEAAQTNEAWFDTLSTEEKAVFMTLFSLRRANVYDKTFYETAADSANKAMELTVGTKRLKAYKELLAWLKGEHKE